MTLPTLPTLSLAPLLDSPLRLSYAVFLALLLIYSAAIPSEFRLFMDTLLGRILAILWIYVVVEGLGWLFGLFTAMAFLAVIYLSPHAGYGVGGMNSVEAFSGSGGGMVEKERVGQRWFVERVLGEHPVSISTEKVMTLPVQD